MKKLLLLLFLIPNLLFSNELDIFHSLEEELELAKSKTTRFIDNVTRSGNDTKTQCDFCKGIYEEEKIQQVKDNAWLKQGFKDDGVTKVRIFKKFDETVGEGQFLIPKLDNEKITPTAFKNFIFYRGC